VIPLSVESFFLYEASCLEYSLLYYSPVSLPDDQPWFLPGLISQPTVFFSHSKPTPAGLMSPETNQRTGRMTALKRAIIHAFLMLSKLLAVTDNGFCDDSSYYLW